MVYGIGETVYDIIFDASATPLSAKAGGSVFNACVSLARRGTPTEFVGEAGADQIGEWIRDFLKGNGCGAENLLLRAGRKSSLSIATLNERGDANYTFYKDHQNDNLSQELQPNKGDILLIGSYYAINPATHAAIKRLCDLFRERGGVIYYDVNFRAAHIAELEVLRPNILENIALADIVKGSVEDFGIVFGEETTAKIFAAHISPLKPKAFICTRAEMGVDIFTPYGVMAHVDACPTTVLSTIGAGDSFNAGFLNAFAESAPDFSLAALTRSAKRGAAFAAEVCASYDNYVAKR